MMMMNKKHLKNIGPIRHCEPPHAHSPGVASGTVARRLRIDVHDNNDNDNDNAWQRGPLWPHGMGPACSVGGGGWCVCIAGCTWRRSSTTQTACSSATMVEFQWSTSAIRRHSATPLSSTTTTGCSRSPTFNRQFTPPDAYSELRRVRRCELAISLH